MNYKILALLICFFVGSQCIAQPIRLEAFLEKQILGELENLGPDSWQEAGREIKFKQIFFDSVRFQLTITYLSRFQNQDSRQNLKLIIGPILSVNNILLSGPNGIHYLNSKITDAVFTRL